ncbi:hypothetical protein LAZ67_7002474 [Cordylochernes scorpioides]|uniref:Uncharacterized protein n=1 Tax=Cordylochernes scorpioides TaxID=51811 RepID=A0ABY6KRF7_9ARAC|nr:hypothetical protein LAZ67_7002474 [Cordylochernes scorpioides]
MIACASGWCSPCVPAARCVGRTTSWLAPSGGLPQLRGCVQCVVLVTSAQWGLRPGAEIAAQPWAESVGSGPGHGSKWLHLCVQVQFSGGACTDPNVNYFIPFSTTFYFISFVSLLQLVGFLDRLRFLPIKKNGSKNLYQICVKNEIKCADAFRMLTVAYGEVTLD